MPKLARNTTTRGSQIALPAHAFFSVAMGVAWVWQAPLSASAGLQALESVWPLRNTAIVLVCLGVVELLMLLLVHNRAAEAITLAAAAVVMASLAGMSVGGHVPGTSWGPVIVWVYIATVHVASVVSLAFNESRGS